MRSRHCWQKKRVCATSPRSTRPSNGRKTRSFSALAAFRIFSTRRISASRNCATPELIEEIAKLGLLRRFHTAEQIIAGGDSSDSIFFLQSGMVSVKRADGLRLATLVPGMAFGEMALVESHRSADVWADTAVQCVELPLDRFHAFRLMHPEVGERIMRNLARLLSRRLGRANTRITMLGAR